VVTAGNLRPCGCCARRSAYGSGRSPAGTCWPALSLVGRCPGCHQRTGPPRLAVELTTAILLGALGFPLAGTYGVTLLASGRATRKQQIPFGPFMLAGITYAVFCQGPYGESIRYRDFMGWDIPWYSAQDSLDTLLVGRQIGLFHLVCYLRDGDRVFETYWTTRRGAEAMDYSYALMDLTVYGRQEPWEDSPPGWPQQCTITRTAGGAPDWPPVSAWPGGRPIAQWPRLAAGRSDDLGADHDGR
jgi:hypothetical protein